MIDDFYFHGIDALYLGEEKRNPIGEVDEIDGAFQLRFAPTPYFYDVRSVFGKDFFADVDAFLRTDIVCFVSQDDDTVLFAASGPSYPDSLSLELPHDVADPSRLPP